MELKFRAYDTFNDEMYYSDKYNSLGHFFNWIEGLEGNGIKLMRFTGLKDLNEVDIYEGDILNFAFIHEIEKSKIITKRRKKSAKWDNAWVEWEEEHCGFVFQPFRWIANSGDFIACEVIGHIYKEKELFKQMQKRKS